MKPTATNSIHITRDDHRRLSELASVHLPAGSRLAGPLTRLREELARAIVTDGPPATGLVTMHSTVRIADLDTGECEEYTLTYPERADPERGLLSVLAPIGTAILGYAEGDELAWETPGGVRRLRIAHVQPPGANGTA